MKILKHTVLFAIVVLSFLKINTAEAEVAVIVNPNNTANISSNDIKRMFLGKLKSFPGGGTVLPVNLTASSDTRKAFDSTALNKTANQVKAYWSKRVFSGKGYPPQEVSSDQEMVSLVKDNRSVIGYVDSANVSADVKVIAKF